MAVMHLGPSQDRFYRIRREWPGHMPPTLFVSKPNRLWCNFKVLTGALVDESCSRPMRLMGRWQLVACDSHVWGNLHNQSKTWSYLKRRYSPMPPKGTIQALVSAMGEKGAGLIEQDACTWRPNWIALVSHKAYLLYRSSMTLLFQFNKSAYPLSTHTQPLARTDSGNLRKSSIEIHWWWIQTLISK